MKIRPVILCGGAGTRLWPDNKKHQANFVFYIWKKILFQRDSND